MTDLTPKFKEALVAAYGFHRGQARKGSGIPYLTHPLAVASIVLEYGGSETEAIAALLHDAAEDQGGERTLRVILRRFGSDVERIVRRCSDSLVDTAKGEKKRPWKERKEHHIEKIGHEQDHSVILVGLADKLANVRSMIADYRVVGDKLWDRFNGGKEGSLWYYRTLVNVYRKLEPGPLADELRRTVSILVRLVK